MKNTPHTFRITKKSEEKKVFLFPKLDNVFFSPQSIGFDRNGLKRAFDEFCEKVNNMTWQDIRVALVNTEDREGLNFYNYIGADRNVGYAQYEYTDPIEIRGMRMPTLCFRGWKHREDVSVFSDRGIGANLTDGSRKKLKEIFNEPVKKLLDDPEVLEFLKKEAIEKTRLSIKEYLDEQFNRLQTAREEFGLDTIVIKEN